MPEHCAAAEAYIKECRRQKAVCAAELVDALDKNLKNATFGRRTTPLNDNDVCCIAEAIRALREENLLRAIVLEESSFGMPGITAIMEAVEANPNRIRELRLGRNNLRDEAAIVIGHTLSRSGCGLKVLDLSENSITKLGIIPIAAALQKPFSEIVELSFHNNKLEGDAAPYIAQAISAAPHLRHLHLGYNALRDGGAAHIARCVPSAPLLSSLDLTANRICKEGGEELVRALLNPSCKVQRLNLRHNPMESDTIRLFADVVARNTSLIQLFLGYMNPNQDSAAAVLAALPQNQTLLLLDIYGWKLSQKTTLPLILDVQQRNRILAALVTDACQAIAPQIDEANVVREDMELHPIYVGPDDRDAYLATRSLRRYSRAQSKRQSRASSKVRSRARADSRNGSRPESNRRSSRPPSRAQSEGGAGQQRNGRSPRSAAQSAPVSLRAKEGAASPVASSQRMNRELEALLEELRDSPCDPKAAQVLSSIVRLLDSTCRSQQQQIYEMQTRIDILERRRECTCGGPSYPSNARANTNAIIVSENANTTPRAANGIPAAVYSRQISENGPSVSLQRAGVAGTESGILKNRERSPVRINVEHSGNRHSTPSAFQRSLSRMSENTTGTAIEYPVTPYCQKDAPPDIAHPNDESGEQHPESVDLQRSVSIQTYPPQIEPSPARDSNPPLRKSVAHAF